uniref:Trichohyalin-plectin-homology domain-containing protein n=1 Tax=Knipowitschia caucasica TaxID=637954 RepID=A0AAV2MPD9_KNICA
MEENRLPIEERRRRRKEHQDFLLAEKMRRQEEQNQRALEAAKEKILQESAPYRDLQRIVLVSKVTKDNQALCQLQREKKASEKADRTAVSEYIGGQLPINKEVQKYEQQIEERKERERQAAHSYNTLIAEKKAQEKRCTPHVPPPQVQNDECADERSTKKATYKMYLESVDLKRIRQQREQQQSAETERQWRREQAEVDARQEGYLKQTQERFKQQQVHREEATLRLAQLKKEQEARARQDEEERKLQVWLFERNLDDKPQKETAKQITEFWSTRVEHKLQEKRAEQLCQINLLRKEREVREQDELESQRKQAQRRQKAENLVHFNSSLVSQKVILKARHKKQELEEKERQAQMNMDKKQQHLDYVEQAIQMAAAEDCIFLPLLAQRQRFEEDDCLQYCENHNVYAMKLLWKFYCLK